MRGALKAFVAALVVAVSAIACGPDDNAQPRHRDDARPATTRIATAAPELPESRAAEPDNDAPAATRVWPASWPVPPLRVMWLVHPSGPVWGSPHRYCWHLGAESGRVCEEYGIWSGVNAYPEAVPGERIPITIESETRPDRVFANVYTRHGNLMVESLQLGPNYPALDLDLDPGDYHIRVIGQWPYPDPGAPLGRRYNEVAYEFGLHVPGAVALVGGCDMTDIGGDLRIVLGSLDDRLRTAADSANRAGCRFKKPIARVLLTLDTGAQTYTEVFHFAPPSHEFGLPLPEELVSETTGGPLPPGDYSRRMIAVTEDGDEFDLTSRDGVLASITLNGR
ncbi:MAG: hypothetical protein OXG33_15065 [Chloroflexi bacterium]|nr:hypothetical protein [Chloroflexota bacterium]